MEKSKKTSRRKFLVQGGLGTLGVLAVGTYIVRNPIRRAILDMVNTLEIPYSDHTDAPMVWFEITADSKIVLHSPKVEMGQGTFTGLAQMVAEEFGVSMAQIHVVHAHTSTGNIDSTATGGSTSIASLWEPLRNLAAIMREMLLTEAANKLQTNKSELIMSDGAVKGSNTTITFADIVKHVQNWEIPEKVTLKESASYKLIGKPVPRVDLNEKVFGDPIFGMDAEMQDMLYGAVIRPTKIGATFVSADSSKAAKIPGVVKIINESDFVGVVATSIMVLEKAKQLIDVVWDVPENINTAAITSRLTVGNGKSMLIQKNGLNFDGEEDVFTLEFRSPIGAHAQLEPNAVVAYVQDDVATIKIATQVVGLTRKEVAKRLGLDVSNVTIIPTYLGGGFGRRLHTPHAVQAAVMSRAVGKPVKYFFTRKEEFQHDMFRPPTHHVLKGKLDENGLLKGLSHHFVSGNVANGSPMIPTILPFILGADIGAIRGSFIQYSKIRNYQSTYWHVELPFATSWWRSLGLLANTFAIESFMDEMAIRANKNAVDFRLMQIKDDQAGIRLKNVIKAASETAGYKEQITDNRAFGIAACVDAGTPCAQVVEVSVENNIIKVLKVTVAMDPGLVVNPDQVRAQCEGAVIMGMSAAMYEEMFVENGELTPTIYGPYKMALMENAPKEIEVVLVQGKDTPGPVGEPPLGPIGAAIANAVRRLTGRRLTKMPLSLQPRA